MKLKILMVAATLILPSCAEIREADGNDVMTPPSDGIVVFKKTKCVKANADGENCDQKTCEADNISNCQKFAEACREFDHVYTGNDEKGTCWRKTAFPNT